MAYSLRCPYCKGKFPWDPKAGYPKQCALCGEFVGQTRDDTEICLPALKLSGVTKAHDDLYRRIEQGSELRAEMAAQQAGCSVEDMAGLKITDLRDARHPGEVAAVPIQNDVTAVMQQQGSQVPWGFTGAGLGFSGAVAAGSSPNAGAHTQHVVRSMHPERVSSFGLNPAGAGVMSDRPALETQQPGYVRRV